MIVLLDAPDLLFSVSVLAIAIILFAVILKIMLSRNKTTANRRLRNVGGIDRAQRRKERSMSKRKRK
jgi:hypothetical protein